LILFESLAFRDYDLFLREEFPVIPTRFDVTFQWQNRVQKKMLFFGKVLYQLKILRFWS